MKFILLIISLGLFFAPQFTEATNPTTKQIRLSEQKLISMINAERAKYGLPALCEWDALSYFAKVHSQNMAAGKVKFGHDGFEKRAEGMEQYAVLNSFGENVAYCFHIEDPLAFSVKGWMNSPGHRRNILDTFEETGVGIAYSKEGKCFLTQLFATRRKRN